MIQYELTLAGVSVSIPALLIFTCTGEASLCIFADGILITGFVWAVNDVLKKREKYGNIHICGNYTNRSNRKHSFC